MQVQPTPSCWLAGMIGFGRTVEYRYVKVNSSIAAFYTFTAINVAGEKFKIVGTPNQKAPAKFIE